MHVLALVQVICLSPNAANISDGNPHRLLEIDRPRLTCTREQCRSHPGVQPKATWTLSAGGELEGWSGAATPKLL